MAALHLEMVPRARATVWVLTLSCRVVPAGGGGCAGLCDGQCLLPGGLGSIARGLLRLSKTTNPGRNCITWCTGNIPWGCAAYFISVLRAGACGSPQASGTGMGFACSTNP